MKTKIPCGGFYLDDTLGVDENGKLGVNVDALGGGLIVNLTKDETVMEFTSSKRMYTADKTMDEVNAALFSGRDVCLLANYIDAKGTELIGLYHYAGMHNGDVAFINVEMSTAIVMAGNPPTEGYDTIILTKSGLWFGTYTDLRNSSVK